MEKEETYQGEAKPEVETGNGTRRKFIIRFKEEIIDMLEDLGYLIELK